MMTTIPYFSSGKTMRLFFALSVFFLSTATLLGTPNNSFDKSDNNPPPPCSNIVAGSIGGTQSSSCSPYDPTTITNVADATSGGYSEEYMWLYKSASTGNIFQPITGATGKFYDPGSITETTTYRRCSRIVGCTAWLGESNDIVVTITNNCCTFSNVGSIGNAQTSCGTFDPAPLTNVATSVATNGGAVEYQWMYKSAATGWNLTAISGATSLTYDPGVLSETTKFRRCGRVVGCTSWLGETNDITITVTNTCCNVTASGSISGNQTNCASFDPVAITSVAPASGGSNNVEYIWMKKNASTGNAFVAIPGTNTESYDPSTVTETTTFRRCARNLGCTSWPGETNDVVMTVTNNCCAFTSVGSIGNTQTSCGSFDPAALTSVAPSVAVNGGTVEYQWMYKSATTGWNLTAIAGATSLTYDPGVLSETTKFRRCARVVGCSTWPAETNDITITVTNTCCNVTASGSISGTQTNCGAFDPGTITSIAPASGGSNNVEYIWMKKNASTGNAFVAMPGTNSETYSPGTVTETTTFRRCARNLGCTSWPGETNDVVITIVGAGLTVTASSTNAVCTDTISVCDMTDYNGSRTIWMPNLGGTAETSLFKIVNNSAKLYQFNDGTAHYVGKAEKTNDPNKQWVFSVWFKDKKDWTDWSAGGGSYKNGGGLTNEHLNWNYYIMDAAKPNKMVGLGDFAGVELDLTHKPSNHLYGMQIGLGANDLDSDFGMSFWFEYTSTSTLFSSGHGDYNTDAPTCTNIAACGGSATASASGGTAPYVYEWSNGIYGNEAKDICTGTYTVTITDANGCIATASTTISTTVCCGDILPGSIGANQSNCGPFDPVAFTSITPATGAGASIEYVWIKKNASTGNAWVTISGATSETYDAGIVSETTTFRRCARNQGCIPYNGESNDIVITINSAPVVSGVTSVDAACNAAANGTASVTVTGGTAPYTYLWDNGANTASITGLAAGTYVGTITDVNGCTTSGTVVIGESSTLASTSTSTDVVCNGNNDGTGMMSVSGGTSPYTYSWDNGATTASLTNLSPGTYVGTATDANGCTIVETITITEPTLLTSSAVSTDATGNLVSDGTATVTATGGTMPLTYLWSDGQTTATATGLAAGTYTVTVTDANGCTTTETVVIAEPAALTNTTTSTDLLCNAGTDGTAMIAVTGGVSPYTYLWSNGATTSSITGLVAGTYTVVATDANGYTTSGTAVVNEPTALASTSTSTDVVCNGNNDGTGMMSVSGGTMPYTYLWDNGATTASLTNLSPGTYVGTATDANGCTIVETITITEPTLLTSSAVSTDATGNLVSDGTATVTATGGTMPLTYLWSDGQTTATATGLAAGTYTVTVTDANGCTTAETVVIAEPTALTNTTTSTDVLCNAGTDGTAMIAVTGGVSPYTYLWSNGATTSSITGLVAGTYTVVATDANGYTTSGTAVVNEPTALASTSTSMDVVCNGNNDGTGMMSVSGGTMPYTYLWDNGATTASLTNLSPGTYVGTATDANGCTIVETITITEPTLLTSSAVSTDATGNLVSDGTATVTATGGTMPLTYLWSDGQTTATATGLAAGTYTVTVTDANGCTTTETVVIAEPTALTNTTTSTDVLCNAGTDGTAMIAVTGGVSPYTYLWSNGATTSSITGLVAGTYTVVATDANGYTTSGTAVVNEPTALASTSTSTDVVCNGNNDGTGMMSVSGGTMPYTYLWDNGATTASLTNLSPGTYVGTATDANGCTIVETITITEPTLLTSSAVSTDATGNLVSDGTATVTATGGTMPLTYLWSDGQTTATATGLAAGTYTVTVTDANGCTTTETVVIAEPTALTNTTTSTDVLCNAGTDGTAMIAVTGGVSPYTYLWSNGATTSSITGLVAGTYTVVATDANGYTTSGTAVVNEPTALASTSTSTDVVCNGNNDGTGMMSVSGGTMPYTYLWDNGATTASLTNLSPGTYVGTATDANGCTIVETITITEPTLLTSSAVSTDATGNLVSDGTATVTATGGTMPLTYLWSDGQTTATATGLAAGTYTVTVTDANGCTTAETVVIAEPTALTNTTTSTDVLCNAGTDGTAMIAVTGGVSPYTYLWSNGATTSSITGLVAGTYTVVATDANGYTTSGTAVVNEPTALASTSTSTDVVCNGNNDGTGMMSVSGGTMPYTYLWDNGATTASLTNLSPGTYVGTATDANGCTIVETITITEPTLLTSSAVSTDATGNLVSDGTATVTATGGTMPLTYLWSDGQTTATATGLAAGTYTVTVTDANGCTTAETVVIAEPTALTNTTTSTDVLCNAGTDGTAMIAVTGGVSPYTYLWSNGATTSSITGLVAGTYTVVATDANGYTTSGTAVVNEPTALASTSTSTDVVCNGNNDGTGMMSVSGGTMPYTYLWDNGATTASLTNLSPGTYVGTATDANGCTIVETITITEPTLLTSSAVSTDATGNLVSDGTATVTATGGTMPLTYLWSDGQTTATATGLAAGTYTVTVTDANGCTTAETVVIAEPTALTNTTTSTDVLCNAGTDGTAMIAVTGGVSPYTYLWSNGATTSSITGLVAGTYTVVATDANGYTTSGTAVVNEPTALASTSTSTDVVCNGNNDGTGMMSVSGGTMPYTYLWDNGATTASLTNLSPGTYVGTATDANGCTIVETITITEPTLLTSSAVSTDATGNLVSDGTATVTATGGTMPLTYLWSDGQTTATATGLAAGTYTVTVTDANGCTTTETVVIAEPTALTNTTTSTDVLCNAGTDGTAMIAVTGGVSPYTYLWSNGATTSSITGLVAGTYTVVATDANGYTTSGTAVVNEPTALASTSTSTDVVCNGNNDGTGMMSVSGGTMPYTYLWDNGATTASLTNLSPGTYVGTATDANGCTIVETITITEPTLLTSSAVSTDATGNLVSDGTATVTATGGTMPLTYLWSDGQTTATATGLAAGTYTVTVTDANGCTTTETVVIAEPTALTNTTTSTDVLCNAGTDGTAMIAVTGGVSPYTYLWSNGATTSSITGLVAGTYTVVATDANGYTTSGTAVVNEPTALVTSNTISNVTCNGLSDASVILSVSGGVAPYTYLWSNGSTDSNLLNVNAGAYSVTVTDANGCSITENVTVSEPVTLALGSAITTDANCFGSSTGSSTVSATGGTMPYTYLWSDGQTTATATGLAAGTYTVSVTDANGCSANLVNVVIGEPAVLETVSLMLTDVTCLGACDGLASITIAGGTAPYTYLWSNGANSASTSGLCPDTYSVVVTDANGCTFTENNIVIVEPTALANSSTLVANVTCNGLSDGSIALSVSGGTTPYTYLWSDGQTSAIATGLVAGTYSVTITDANGCSIDINNTVVSEPNVLANTSTTVVNTSCFGTCDGSVSVNITGGTAPYTYAWSQIVLNQITGNGTSTISDLCKGMYSVTVTDANGCVISVDSIIVTEPSPMFNGSTTISAVSCNGAMDGSIVLDIIGGTLPYTYAWDNGQTTADATGLGAGTYSVTVTDANGCTLDVTGAIVTEPLIFANGSLNASNVTCHGLSDGSISLNLTGGTIPYTYAWSDGQTTASAIGLSPGTYSVTATDANGCTVDVNNVAITEPAPLVISAPIIVNTTCFGSCDGSISISVTGGTAPYTYDWTEVIINQITGDGTPTISNLCKGMYSVLVTDDNGCTILLENIEVTEPAPIFENNSVITNVTCNGAADGAIDINVLGGTAPYTFAWDNGLTGQSITGLTAGTYAVTVTDASGCTLEITNVFVGEPLELANATTTITDISCNSSCDGTIQLAIVGGTMPYTYSWSNGETTADISNLCAGSYSVTVTDVNGCTVDVNNITVNEPTQLSAMFTATDVQCYTSCDGTISTVISGGTAPYTYSWSGGQSTANVTNLCNGTYVLNVTDANGCTLIDSVVITQPEELKAVTSSTDVSCFGACDGTGNALITGGIMPYTVMWSNGDTLVNIDSLCPGSYALTVMDANNCIAASSVVITEPTEIQVTFVIDYSMNMITASAVNGVPGYTYAWSNGTTGSTVSNVGNGNYLTTVTDASGCSVTDSIVFVEGGGIINQFTVNVGPNPFVNATMMRISTTQTDVISVEIYDVSGNVVEQTFNGNLEENTALELVINGNELEPGLYLARVLASDGSSLSKKLIVLE